MKRKFVVVVVALVELVVIGGVVGQRVLHWHQVGRAGFTYHSERTPDDARPDLSIFGRDREVFIIAPGSPAERAGLELRDRILSVNGVATADIDGLEQLSADVAAGAVVRYEIERRGKAINLDVELQSPLRSPIIAANLAVSLVASLIWIGISLLVYWGRPDSRIAAVFFAMCSCGGAFFLLLAGAELDYPALRGLIPYGGELHLFFLIVCTGLASVLFTNLVLHMALVFPKPRPVTEQWPQVFVWLHMVPFALPIAFIGGILVVKLLDGAAAIAVLETVVGLLCITLVMSMVRRAAELGLWIALRSSPWPCAAALCLISTQGVLAIRLAPKNWVVALYLISALAFVALFLLCLMLYSIFAALSLYRSYRDSGLELRQQVRWPLWGTATALVLSAALGLFSVATGAFETEIAGRTYLLQMVTTLASKVAYLLIPVSFAFAILKYRLLDIDVIIRKTVIYTVVTSCVVAVYLMIAGASSLAAVRSMGLESQMATVLATLASLALFVPVRTLVQRVVDRRFFQRERDLEEALSRISRGVFQGGDPEQMLPNLADAVQRALRTRGIAILVRPPGGDRLVVDTTLGLGERTLQGLSVAREDPGLRSDDLLSHDGLDGDLAKLIRSARARHVVIAKRDGRPVALLLVGRPQGRDDYDDEEKDFLSAIADQLAVAVGRSMQRQAEGELEKARAIQKSLLPQDLPKVAGLDVAARWEPAREVSGDYYDVLRLDENRLLVCIGDVVGKGLPAALLMSTLQAAVKAVAATVDTPATLCEQVRDVVRASLHGGTFVTFCCVLVDRRGNRVISTNAGHNPPILARSNGDVVRLENGGPAMARILSAGYTQEEVAFESGDRLFLFTDGATEAMDPEGEMFGDERLARLASELVTVTVAEAERGIAGTVIAHARGVLQDDLTLVVVGAEAVEAV